MEVLLWPHSSLKTVCAPVDPADPDFLAELEAMKKVMWEAGGIGLAANQVGLKKRMLLAKDLGTTKVFVNPRIVALTGTREMLREGCLSLPGVFVDIRRATSLVVESLDVDTGALFVSEYTGKLAHILAHEIDHLDGKMMIDNLPGGRKDQIRQHMKTIRRSR